MCDGVSFQYFDGGGDVKELEQSGRGRPVPPPPIPQSKWHVGRGCHYCSRQYHFDINLKGGWTLKCGSINSQVTAPLQPSRTARR